MIEVLHDSMQTFNFGWLDSRLWLTLVLGTRVTYACVMPAAD